jgi:hypothetical protein
MSYVRRTARLPIKLLAVPLAAAIVGGCQGALPGGVSRSPASAIAPSALSRQLRPGAPLPSWMRFRPMAGTGRVYVSMFNFTNVNEYAASNKKNAPPLCAIPNQHYVNGIGVDRSLNLWVPNANASGLGFTAVFAPSCGKQLFTIADQDGQPASVIFDRKGNAYVENIYGPPSNLLAGNVDVYRVKTRHKVAELTYKDPHTYIWSDEALDAGGDLFVIYSDIYNKGHVIEFPGAKAPAKSLPISVGFPGGLAFDSAGNLLVGNQDTAAESVYAPPFTGSPVATFSLKAASVPCRFNATRKNLYCSDFTNSSVDVYGYAAANPGSTKYLYSFNNGIPHNANNAGIALAPAPPN